MNPWLVARAGMAAHRAAYAVFLMLIAIAVAAGVAISAQEAAVRRGSARAADKFDLLVGAPGSQTDLVLAAIYLRPGTAPLLSPAETARALAEPRVKFAAPLGFGDSFKGSPVVGSTAAFVDYLSGGLQAGRVFVAEGEAVAGAAASAAMGETFHPSHGTPHDDGDDEDEGYEHGVSLTIVGRMKPTGTPWDNAIVIPIESVWRTHQLPTGHPESEARVGPPFDPERTPGVPAIVMAPRSVSDAYGLRGMYRTPASMAFFPAEALTPLYAIMGDVRDMMSWFALATQGLVVVAILAGVIAILNLHRRQFAVLRALGAPRLYIFACVFTQIAIVIVAGALAGLGLGAVASVALSGAFTARTGIALPAGIGLDEIALVASFVALGLVAAIAPALMAWRRSPVEGLSGR